MRPPPALAMKFKRACSGASATLVSSLFIFLTLLSLFIFFNEIQFHDILNLQPAASSAPSNDTHQTSSQPDFRLFIGILTQADQYWRRNILRLVYGAQALPGTVQVDIKFVFCNLTKEDQKVLVALEIMRYDDIIILNCTENMNSGKTYTYFSSLPDLLANDGLDKSGVVAGPSKPYNYVMKADDDIFIRLGPLVESLSPLAREDMYYGFTIPCREMNPYNHYMSGMAYVLSWDLVEWIRGSDIPKKHTVGPEDKILGDWLKAGNRAKNRYNVKPAMYDYPVDVKKNKCSREFRPDTIAVHRLKSLDKWVKTLRYFNFTDRLKPSKLYHIP